MELPSLKCFDPSIVINVVTYDTLNDDIVKVKYTRYFHTFFKDEICICPQIIIHEILPVSNEEKEYFYSTLNTPEIIKELDIITDDIMSKCEEITKENYSILLNYITGECYPQSIKFDNHNYFAMFKKYLINNKCLPKALKRKTISEDEFDEFEEFKRFKNQNPKSD